MGLVLMSLVVSVSAAAQSPTLMYGLFQDHAVLQRDKPIEVWGHAAAGETVTVSLDTARASARADAAGQWSVKLPALSAGGPFVLEAKGSSSGEQAAHDVLVGDVFLCSGQSNMELPVRRSGDTDSEIRNSTNDRIRMLTVQHAASPTPLTAFHDPVQWQSASPGTVPEWSATCFYFARELQKSVPVPIGLVHSSWGGSNIRPWLSAAALRAAHYGTGVDLLSLYARSPEGAQAQFGQQWEQWWRDRTGQKPGSEPWGPGDSSSWTNTPPQVGDWRFWGVPALHDFSGEVWFRTHITLTGSQAKSATRLDLGAINMVDETWLNGHVVGNTFGFDADRTYTLAPGLLHAGDNLLVVNTMSNYGSRGMLNSGSRRQLVFADGSTLPLDGSWQYQTVPQAVGYPPRTPWEPVGGLSTLYNAMIAPLGHFGIRAALWYQGESNTGEWSGYQALLTGLMADWRRQFGAQLPFLVVQLPNYGPQTSTPVESDWAGLRAAQKEAVAQDAHAGLAVTIDIGDPYNLHPTNKQEVGRRLARAARHVVYGETIAPSGPVAVSAARLGDKVMVDFRDVEGALVTYSHESPIGFELCGEGPNTCKFAVAHLDGTKVELSEVGGPWARRVRYCWADSPVCTLFDGARLPAGPFELPIGAAGQLTRERDHQRLLDLLQITELRRGPDGNPASPDAANFDESKVEPYTLPDPLVFKGGQRVTSAEVWWKARRSQIVAAFDNEMYGHVPANIPKVSWEVVRTRHERVGRVPVVARDVVGHVDNSAYPVVKVDIELTVTTPEHAGGPVPVMMELGLAPEAQQSLRQRFPGKQWASYMGPGPDWQTRVLAKGWGYAVLIPTSIQADNGEGLTQGIIGLTNKGEPRQPGDWGALRAWAWGASRALDYLQTDPAVDGHQVGIEGLSRYGKAALLAMAYEPRFAIGFIGSSGEAGAKLSRRTFGEQVENIASTSEYHWMAGNFLKYAGPLTRNDLPVDAHELIALCAPRPVFISSGSQAVEGGWVDAKGMFLAAVAAGPVYKLLKKKDLGTTEFPPLETALMDGDIAFRQHRYGHTTGPNWPAFLTFASRYIQVPAPKGTAATEVSVPVERRMVSR